MIESIAVISGKGGSGKTTLSLLLARLLSMCGRRVLLIDCDMSTHGATFFFEPVLKEKAKFCTVDDVFAIGEMNVLMGKDHLNVARCFDFIPSRVDFPSSIDTLSLSTGELFEKLSFFVRAIDDDYDAVIFDCQAGYSSITEAVVQIASRILAVLEADAISASALRVLYSQLAQYLNKGNAFQIFNKVSEEESDVYSKLIYGTLFTNLSPIVFDFNVRKAFVNNELPIIDAQMPTLTYSTYNLGIVMFPSFKKELREYMVNIQKDMIKQLTDQIDEVDVERRTKKFEAIQEKVIPIMNTTLGAVSVFLITESLDGVRRISYHFAFLIFALVTFVTIVFSQMRFNKAWRHENTNKRFMLKRRRDELEEEVKRLQMLVDENSLELIDLNNSD